MSLARDVVVLLGVIVGILACGSLAAVLLRVRATTDDARALASNVGSRVLAWWLMVALVLGATWLGPIVTICLFAGISTLALREFMRVAQTREADRRTWLWVFFLVLPGQYILLAVNWYGMFAIFIPVYAFAWLAIRSAISDDTEDFLARTARIQWGVMVCVYAISHVPALLQLDVVGSDGPPVALLLFYTLVVQGNDVLQFVWGKALGGKHVVLPSTSPNKSWEGLVGGLLSTAAVGALLAFATPFVPWQGALIAAGLGLLGFLGDIVLSAIKRDAGIKDYGSLIAGHGGVLDRIDSLCFSAPVFFHIVRFYFANK